MAIITIKDNPKVMLSEIKIGQFFLYQGILGIKISNERDTSSTLDKPKFRIKTVDIEDSCITDWEPTILVESLRSDQVEITINI